MAPWSPLATPMLPLTVLKKTCSRSWDISFIAHDQCNICGQGQDTLYNGFAFIQPYSK